MQQSQFMVGECYRLITQTGTEEDKGSFLWKIKVSNKIRVFLWKVHLTILRTKKFLARMILIHDVISMKCMQKEETWFHILWECTHAKVIWSKVFAWWGIELNKQISCHGFLFSLCRVVKDINTTAAWHITVAISLWNLWKDRNMRVFQQKDQDLNMIFYCIREEIKFWCMQARLITDRHSNLWCCDPSASIVNAIHEGRNEFINRLVTGFNVVIFCDGA